ncbi:MAG: tripartite tricarboxylate transporter substrate binding protein [Ramlibacter sp.]|nr:tripartite tricarboxylate transporter substrate binding protein [Ramlibacter sp.]
MKGHIPVVRRIAFLVGICLCVTITPVSAQFARAKPPIQLVVLFPGGSSADIPARALAEGMAKFLHENVIVVNKPGGGGAIGYKYVATAPADGRTLVWSSNSISTNYHHGTMDVSYKSFAPVAQATVEIPVVVVRSNSPWKSLTELLDYARANPGTLSLGNSGAGSQTHISAVALLDAGKATAVHVPFGSAQVVPSLLGGHIDAVVQLPAAVAPFVEEGSLRVLGSLGAKRTAVFPTVPTAQEQGLAMRPLDLWRGISVPLGTPQPMVARLEKAIEATLKTPEFISAGKKFGFEPRFMNRQDFGLMIAKDDAELAVQMRLIGLATR